MVSKALVLFNKKEGHGTDALTYQKLVTMGAQDTTTDIDLIWKVNMF